MVEATCWTTAEDTCWTTDRSRGTPIAISAKAAAILPKLNFGDCFAYALANFTGQPLLFIGDEFDARRRRTGGALEPGRVEELHMEL